MKKFPTLALEGLVILIALGLIIVGLPDVDHASGFNLVIFGVLAAIIVGYQLFFVDIKKSEAQFKEDEIKKKEEALKKRAEEEKEREKELTKKAEEDKKQKFAPTVSTAAANKSNKYLWVAVVAIAAVIIWLLLFNGEVGETVELEGIRFTAPAGWTVTKYPSADFFVQVNGPQEGQSRPNFIMSRKIALGSFDFQVEQAKTSITENGASIIDQENTFVGGEKTAVQIEYRKFNEAEGIYKKGKTIIADLGFGDVLLIMFTSREDSYPQNVILFNQSIGLMTITQYGR